MSLKINSRRIAIFALCAALFWQSTIVRASSWDPALIVNTEAFQIIDDGDGNSNLTMQFGDSLGETLLFDVTLSRFNFSDDLHADGNLAGSGTLAIEGSANIDGSTLAVDSSTDSVGIGTTTPSTNLEVLDSDAGTNTADPSLRITRITSGTPVAGFGNALQFFLETNIDTVNRESGRIETIWDNPGLNAQTSQMLFWTSRLNGVMTEFMRIDENGQLGIGTAAPETKLEVVGTASGQTIQASNKLNSSGTLAVESGAVIDANTLVVNAYNDRVGIGTLSPETTLEVVGTASGTQLQASNFLGSSGVTIFNARRGNGSQVEALSILTASGITLNEDGGDMDTRIEGHSDENLIFFDAGNDRVGIGTGTPETKLEVLGTASGLVLQASNQLNSSGSLNVEGVSTFGGGATFNGAAVMNGSTTLNDPTTAWDTVQILNANDSGFAVFDFIGTNNLFNVDTIGTMGITVNEAGIDADFRVEGNNNINMLFVDAGTDRVGIGTGAPKATLDVVGTISGSTLNISGMKSCNLDTDVNGLVTCGTDSGGASFATTGSLLTYFNTVYVNTPGDTMTGALTVKATASGSRIIASNFLGSSGITIFNGRMSNGSQVEALSILTGSGFIINEDGSDMDFRVEGHSDENLFATDAANDRIGIGTSTPETKLEVLGTTSGTTIVGSNFLGSSGVTIFNARRPGNSTQVEAFSIATASGVVINADGSDMNFVVAGHSATVISTDASTNSITIGGAATFYDAVNMTNFSNNGLAIIENLGGANLFNVDTDQSGGIGVTINEDAQDADFRVESQSDTFNFFSDASTNRVGIGTGTPETKLEVLGTTSGTTIVGSNYLGSSGITIFNARRGNGSQVEALSILTGSGFIINEDGSDMDFRVEGHSDENLIATDAANDRIGIGTNAPETKLEIVGTVSGSALVGSNFLGSSGVTIFNARRPGNGSQVEALSIATASGIVINEDGNDMDFRVESGGNTDMFTVNGAANMVGIGVAPTGATFEVMGDLVNPTITRIIENNAVDVFEVSGDFVTNNSVITMGDPDNLANAATFTVTPDSNGGGEFTYDRGAFIFNEAGGDYDFRVETDSNINMLFVDGGTNRVGIGTGSPTATLTVSGSTVLNENGGDFDTRIEGDTDQNLAFVDASTDRVGIGTATPGAKLEVNGTMSGHTFQVGPIVLFGVNSKAATGSGMQIQFASTGSIVRTIWSTGTAGSAMTVNLEVNGTAGSSIYSSNPTVTSRTVTEEASITTPRVGPYRALTPEIISVGSNAASGATLTFLIRSSAQ